MSERPNEAGQRAPDPIEAAARADAAACFDNLAPAWFQPSERDGFIEASWKDSVPRVRAAIRAYLLAEAARKNSGQRNIKDQWEARVLTRLAASLDAT